MTTGAPSRRTADLGAVARLPEVLLRPDLTSSRGLRRPRLIATGYGGSIRRSFSGSSHYLIEAGMRAGTLDGGFTLYSERRPDWVLRARGAAWKADRWVRHESRSGFKFSPAFSESLWSRHVDACAGTDILNNFQLYSPTFRRRRGSLDIGSYYYLDGTLHDYLVGYREFDVAAIDPATVRKALDAERAGYEDADGIAVMSEFVASSLREHYGIDRANVHVVLPGANLDDRMAEQVAATRADRAAPAEFVVGFIGVYPERKGLPKLAAAVARLRESHVPVRLQVVGRCPPDIAAMDGVDALGVIDKAADSPRFAKAMARVDLGCQLSTVELSGIATLEYLRCGIPVLATQVGGIPDILTGGGTLSVPVDVTTEQVAVTLERVISDTSSYAELVAEAVNRSTWARWDRTAHELGSWLSRTR